MTESSHEKSEDATNLHELMQEFQALYANGTPVSIESFANLHPDVADDLRELLPMAEILAQLSGDKQKQGEMQHAVPFASNESKTLGDFRIIRELGRGGMGIVYEANQLSLDRRVALKVLPYASLLNDRQLARFKNEARAAATLKHPHIVNVFSIGCEKSIHYYGMELIEGNDLSQVIHQIHRPAKRTQDPVRDGSSPQQETQSVAPLSTECGRSKEEFTRSIARLGIQAAEALHYAHQHGVVHRDIKPANLLLDDQGELHITDFGLAQFQSTSPLTVTGDLVGTLRYMSPEQIDDNQMVDHRTDIYSLGLTLYEFSTGSPAYSQIAHQALANAVLNKAPIRPRLLDPQIPRDFETIVMKAMAKEPSERYASAQDLADDLDRFLSHRVVKAKPSGVIRRFSRFAKRNPHLTAMLAITTVLFALLAGGSATVAYRFAQDSRTKSKELYAKTVRLALSAMNDGRRQEAGLLLDLVRDSPSAQSFEFDFLDHFIRRLVPQQTLMHGSAPGKIAFAPDNDRVITGDWLGELRSWDVNTGRMIATQTKHAMSIGGLCVTKQGLVISGGKDGTVRFWDASLVERGVPIQSKGEWEQNNIVSLDATDQDAGCITLAIASGYADRTSESRAAVRVVRYQLDSGSSETLLLDGEFVGKPSVCFSPNKKWFAVGDDAGQLKLWDTATWELAHENRFENRAITKLQFAVDNRELAIGRRSTSRGGVSFGDVCLLSTTDWSLLGELPCHVDEKCRVQDLSYSPDGALLAVACEEMMLVWNNRRECVARLKPHDRKTYCVCFSANGKLATSGQDNAVHIWQRSDLERTHQSVVTVPPTSAPITDTAFLPDGTVAFAHSFGQIQIVDPDSGTIIREEQVDGENCNIARLSVSPNGKKLAVTRGRYDSEQRPGRLVIFNFPDFSIDCDRSLPEVFRINEFSPDGRHLFLGGGGSIIQFDTATNRIVDEYVPKTELGTPGWITSLAVYPDSKRVALTTGNGIVQTLNVTANGLLNEREWLADENKLWMVAITPDGKTLATTGSNGTLRTWDSDTGELIDEIRTPTPQPFYVSFTSDGQRLASTGNDGHLRLWDVPSGNEVLGLKLSSTWIWHGVFSADGDRFACGNDRGFVINRSIETNSTERRRSDAR